MAIIDVLSCIAPEFDNVDINRRNCIIAIAEKQVDQAVFEDDYEEAVAYLAAHLLSIAQYRRGNAGAFVTALREGDLQKAFSTPQPIDSTDLSDSAYGREFIRIRRMHVIGVVCAN